MDLISYLVKINIEFEIGMKAEGDSGVNYVVKFRNAKQRKQNRHTNCTIYV